METKNKLPGLFDIDSALLQIEKNAKMATEMIVDKKSREIAETVTTASMEFARAQAAAVKVYADAVKKALLP